jgi:hypothetical protein
MEESLAMSLRKPLIIAALLAFAAITQADAAVLKAVTLVVGPPHPGAIVYGPADMLCDLDKCHMFTVPGFPKNGTVDFQMPALKGQDRTELRRCFNVCHVSVLGYVSADTGHPTPDQQNPSITITPIELRLDEQIAGSK